VAGASIEAAALSQSDAADHGVRSDTSDAQIKASVTQNSAADMMQPSESNAPIGALTQNEAADQMQVARRQVQRADIADELAKLRPGDNQHTSEVASKEATSPVMTQTEAADSMGVAAIRRAMLHLKHWSRPRTKLPTRSGLGW